MSAIAAGVVAAGAIGGAVISSEASANAARSQDQAATRANQQQSTMYDKQQANMQPYLDAGKDSLGQLQSSMPDLTRQFSSSDFKTDPGYDFALNQGLQAMQRSAAAKGGLDSVGTMQELNDYAQGQASNQYQNAYNRFTQNQQQKYNMLSGVAGMGNTANGQMANVGMNAVNNMNGNTLGQGNAAAAGYMAQGNNMSNLIGTGANMYTQNQAMNKMFPQQQQQQPQIYGGGISGYGGGAGSVAGSGNVFAGPDSSMSSLAIA